MHNFDDFEHKSYVEAKRVEYSAKDHLNFVLFFLLTMIKVSGLMIYEVFIFLLKLFNPDKPKDISGQTALITGAANGLGRAIAFRLAREKVNIAIVDLNLAEAQRTASEIEERFDVKTVAYKVDVSDFDAIQQLKVRVEKDLGYVDILVNNAGILSAISLQEGEAKDIQKLIDVNLTSHFWTVRTFLNKMIERKRGHIVAISSIFGKMTMPSAVGYCATKFGVRGFMGALYDELCISNHQEFIKLTTVYPSFINTRKELSDLLDANREILPRMTPEYAADEVVKGILLNKIDITIPATMRMAQFSELYPIRVRSFMIHKYMLLKASSVYETDTK